jgi:DNA-binding transcriptional regulator YiaG
MDLGLLQKDVAKYIGVATDNVRLWEKDRTKPSEIHLRKIMQFLKIRNKRLT